MSASSANSVFQRPGTTPTLRAWVDVPVRFDSGAQAVVRVTLGWDEPTATWVPLGSSTYTTGGVMPVHPL